MSPNATSESRYSNGLVNVFKSLTGIRPLRNQNSRSQLSAHQTDAKASDLRNKNDQDPSNYKLLFEQLKAENCLADRIAAADSLRLSVQQFPVNGLSCILTRAKDLIEPANPKKARTVGFQLLIACIQNASLSDPERLAYFRILTAQRKNEDFHWKLSAIIELTKNGRDLTGFHYEILPVLSLWLRETWTIISSHREHECGIASLGQETDLALLFELIVDIIKFNFNISNEQNIGELIEVVLSIVTRTQSSNDIRSCIDVFNAIVTYGDVPGNKLESCVRVLCSVYLNAAVEIKQEVWKLISDIYISHNGENAIRIIFKLLRKPSLGTNQGLYEVRGALLVLDKLFVKNGKGGYPLVPFSFLIKSLEKISVVDNIVIKNDILRLILSLLSSEGKQILKNVIEEDWNLMFDVVTKCACQILERPRCWIKGHSSEPKCSACKNYENHLVSLTGNLQRLITRIESLLVQHSNNTDFFQWVDCVKFLVSFNQHLPETCARLVIDIYIEYRFCYPSDLDWKENLTLLLRSFFFNRENSTQIRLHALKAGSDVFNVLEAVNEKVNTEITHLFVDIILEDVRDEEDILVLQEILSLITSFACATFDNEYFYHIIDTIHKRILLDQSRHHILHSSTKKNISLLRIPNLSEEFNNLNQTPSNVLTVALIQIFILCMDKSVKKAQRLFREILWILRSDECEVDARVSALRFLCRLRADWAHRIFLVSFTETDGLAALLNRTLDPLSRKQADDNITHRHLSRADDIAPLSSITRSASIGKSHVIAKHAKRNSCGNPRTGQNINQLWMEPDHDNFSHLILTNTSSILFSISISVLEDKKTNEIRDLNKKKSKEIIIEEKFSDQDGFMEDQSSILDIAQYIQIITSLLQKECDWEIYSYIIVHLHTQLMNQALLVAAIPQIKILREVLCEQIKSNKIQDPPILSGLRKSDILTCLFQILNVVMSYHKHFSKNEEDEIVRIFLHGVGEKTSKCCVHALSICCHELPGSTSKMLVTILTKFSQIITQSHVAIHILEFLACLARLPKLYVNFREEEYRIVFAICFRYLQYVRDQKNKEAPVRNSTVSGKGVLDIIRGSSDTIPIESNPYPTTSDDLPEYVYALAHHVIIFWFLSLKLADRPAQVRWIIKNLISTNLDGVETIDEQAQVTIDFMQRVTYADVDQSGPDPSFKKDVFGEINRKRWVIGDSLLTVEQATRKDWAQITIHQPSGTSSYLIQEKIRHPPPHQTQNSTDAMKDTRHSDENIKLPSHLLLQLCASIPMSRESMRPIPLLDCKGIDRAVSNLNRTFTVDGHKIGVIYIGENQKKEAEILSNIQGSSDYIKFLFGLGTLTKLRGANFNTQGLDRQADSDGEYTFCWRDRVTEIVFHVTTQMPTDLDNDPQCSNKKKHIGNDFVNIIFNNSGLPFDFNTFPSAFNFVNIIITPESQSTFVARRLKPDEDDALYKVQVMSKPGFPEISPAAETKIMSLSTLPDFIRLLSLNASVFSLVWAHRAGGEHFSPWRSRLREIRKIREASEHKSSSISPPNTSHVTSTDSRNVRDGINSLRRSSINFFSQTNDPVSQRSSESTSELEIKNISSKDVLLESLDFSKWA
ncbi:putative gtpase activating protein [Erysiphe neolycopersici]|uniref:Putative gtpase activating protein n=1 Tax=Erysiphe neolycopersici TaxID=212602 RepID=A0A420HTD5_9PEZI|nr:putative gtpase activating protein [Erysiphe neolycopersici]